MQKSVLENIVLDYISGLSLRKLRSKYGYTIGNLHYHLKKRNVLRQNNIVKSLKLENPLMMGVFIGIWAGDGSKFIDHGAYTIKIHINKNDLEFIAFFRVVMEKLFGKRVTFIAEKETNQGLIRFYSRFIYRLIDNYVAYEENKTLSIRLKEDLARYNGDFLKGFLIGITLSDGYIKEKFILYSISEALINNVKMIVENAALMPYIYMQEPKGYGRYPNHILVINKQQTKHLKHEINQYLEKCDYHRDISALKGYKQKSEQSL